MVKDMKTKIRLDPSNKLFWQLRSQTIDFASSIAELIDNSISQMIANECSVIVDLRGSWNKGIINSLDKEKASIIVTDDAGGIPFSKMHLVLSPAALAGCSSDPLNEHGMGMKTALVSLGTKEGSNGEVTGFNLATKTKDDDKVYVVNKIAWGELDVDIEAAAPSFPKGHGTIIEIENLNNVLKDKLEKTLKDSFDNVQREVSNKYGGKMDLLLIRKSNEEVWEVKIGLAGYEEFMQLVSYLLVDNKKRGVLLARDFNENAKNLAADCEKLFDVSIELKQLSTYNL